MAHLNHVASNNYETKFVSPNTKKISQPQTRHTCLSSCHYSTQLQRIVMPLPRQTGRWRYYVFNLSVCSSVRPFVLYQACEQDILKTNEPILMHVGTICHDGKGIKSSTLGVKKSKLKLTWRQNR